MIDRRPLPTLGDLRLALALAAGAAHCLQQRHVLLTKDETIHQLQAALDSRVTIEQAKGVLSARLDIDMEEAFARLRSYARARQEKLGDLAARVARGAVPAELDRTT
ncbi:ANTAR domain-containing protein [Streptomyces sp. NPDC059009]|uniref:ANTAR domain-containing protein n=1 Tax=Streptomyces sp. NPDC059009 TaxID=3346694 RepID=UPI00367D93AA